MNTPCDKLESFAEGTLTALEAEAFSEHLATCERCQAGLTALLQLEHMGQRYVERHGPAKVPWYFIPRNQWAAAGAVAACLLALVVALRPAPPRPLESRALWAELPRTLEARVTYELADVHRPLEARAMGSDETAASREIPPELLTALKERKDWRQLFAAQLALGRPDGERARRILLELKPEQKWAEEDVLCDLGVTYYVSGDYSRALELFGKALRRKPAHVQALWNRALTYQKLGLYLLAREDFAAVEKFETDEAWRKDASARKDALVSALRRKDRWNAARRVGDALAVRRAGAEEEALQFVDMSMLRRDFYDAVRTRSSADEVRALLPLARRLDGMARGQPVLAEYVQRIASRDFTRRATLAQRYARLINGTPDEREWEESLKVFLASSEEDIALGALTYAWQTQSQYSEELIQRARASEDPWFKVLGLQVQAADEVEEERYDKALELLEEALDLSKRAELPYRRMAVENDLAHVLAWLSRIEEAREHAEKGLQLARIQNQWDKEGVLLQALGNVSRLAADVTLGRAYYGEALLVVGQDEQGRRNIHQNLAHLAIEALELDTARAEIDQAMDWKLSLPGAEALVDIARTRPSPRDEDALQQVLREERGKSPARRVYAKFLEGRFLLTKDAAKGRALLEETIREAKSLAEQDVLAKHARAYSYTSLIFDDAGRGDFEKALSRFGEELGFEVPGECVLGITEDTERQLVVVRGKDGRLLSDFKPDRRERLPAYLEGVLPTNMVEALKPCTQVDVLARPPLQGRAGLLPPEIAWRYRTRKAAPRRAEGSGVHLVVHRVQYSNPKDESLQWTPRANPGLVLKELPGLEATATRVLKEMTEASEIDLATHGKINPATKGTYLLLARDEDGKDELYEDRIRQQRMTKAPLVVLAACEAARGATALHELDSLPNAFLAAGARAVIAATQKIPDQEASRFFGEVRERIHAGSPPALAVRDELQDWIHEGKHQPWLHGILVFE